MLKFGNVLPLDEPPEDDVVELWPLELELEPPHPAATSASPTAAKVAVVTNHPLLRVKWVPPRSFRLCGKGAVGPERAGDSSRLRYTDAGRTVLLEPKRSPLTPS